MPSTNTNTIAGVLLGTAVGDALGLPHEGLHPRRIARRLQRAPLHHAMLLRRGLLSDDTEHTAMVARAFAESSGDVARFTRSFARQLRRWIVSLPPGLGLATLRSSVRLLLGASPGRSGVRSAGNGPAMRAAVLGVLARNDAHLVDLVRAATRITHTDPRAEHGARVVARLAGQLAAGAPDPSIVHDVADPELRSRLEDAWTFGGGLEDYRAQAGYERGVSGFVVHTVPAAVYCALRHPEPRDAITTAVRLGGDTDTTAAIAGALVGARVGATGLPGEWIDGIADWPLSTEHLRNLAATLTEGGAIPRQRWLAALPRNLGLVAVIAGHVMLRLLGR